MPKTVVLAPNVVLRVIGGEALLLKLGAEDVFALNDTGTRIVQLVQEGRDLASIVDVLSGEYEAERSTLEQAVTDLIAVLAQKELVIERRREVG